jgi:N-acetylglucosamine-6-phosphate deacetylase
MQTILKNLNVHTGNEILQNHSIEIENGIIKNIFPSENHQSQQKDIAAGFIDLHINGGSKHYFTQNPTEESIDDIYQSSLRLGTTHVLPCLITSPLENILKGIEAIQNYMAQNPRSGVLGMHLEGPFLNPLKRGAHLAEYVKKPTDNELQTIIEHGKDVIKIMTIAPEQFTENQIEMLLESGINLSAGHSNATFKQAQSAYNQGIKLCTHLYNAMSQMGHREVGLVGATFDNDDVYAPIILDGFHCDYAAAKIAHKIKKDKLFLISDALFVGSEMKQFQWGGFDAFLKDGQYRNSEGNLAGAAISMADAVRNAVRYAGVSKEEAVKMATIRPAKVIGMSHKIGKIEVGYPANFVVFDENLEKFEPLIFS